MPRAPVKPRGEIGRKLSRTMQERDISVPQLAAAARVNRGTVYDILVGFTRQPHYSTLRKLCKILELDIAHLIGAEQLELAAQRVQAGCDLAAHEDLLIEEIAALHGDERQAAAEVCILALLEVKLGEGLGSAPSYYIELRKLAQADADLLSVVRSQLASIHTAMKPEAVRQALGALLDLRAATATGEDDVRVIDMIAAIHSLRNNKWVGIDRRKERIGTLSAHSRRQRRRRRKAG